MSQRRFESRSRRKCSPWAGRILALRERQHLTQSELGERLDLSDATVSRWEQGRSEPSLKVQALLVQLESQDPAAFGPDDFGQDDDQENFGEDCACFLCGCTVLVACPGGCSWDHAAEVHDDLADKDACSVCVALLLSVKRAFPDLSAAELVATARRRMKVSERASAQVWHARLQVIEGFLEDIERAHTTDCIAAKIKAAHAAAAVGRHLLAAWLWGAAAGQTTQKARRRTFERQAEKARLQADAAGSKPSKRGT